MKARARAYSVFDKFVPFEPSMSYLTSKLFPLWLLVIFPVYLIAQRMQ